MVLDRPTGVRPGRFGLVVTGEANQYAQLLERLVGPQLLTLVPVNTEDQVLHVVESGQADAVVLDEAVVRVDALRVLRMIRRLDQTMLVLLLARQADQRRLAEALDLAAFSVVMKPLRLEELLNQLYRMMLRIEEQLRRQP